MIEILNAEHLALIPAVWIYCGIFIVCLLEGTPIVGSFFPGGTIIFAVGTVAGMGVVDPIWSLVLAALGSIIGDIIGFCLLRMYGEKFKPLRKLISGVRDNKGWLSDIFDRKYFTITILAKLIPFVRAASSLAAAVRSVSVWGYVFATILASTLWAAAGIGTGYGLSELIDPKYTMLALIAFCGGSILWGLIKHLLKVRASKRLSSTE